VVAVDQEGGTVRRFDDLGPDAARHLGSRPTVATFGAYRTVGRALADRGIDLDLGPVAEIERGGIIGSRSSGRPRPPSPPACGGRSPGSARAVCAAA
jgi:beta-glucosidase-like glycosyl hydrolase